MNQVTRNIMYVYALSFNSKTIMLLRCLLFIARREFFFSCINCPAGQLNETKISGLDKVMVPRINGVISQYSVLHYEFDGHTISIINSEPRGRK